MNIKLIISILLITGFQTFLFSQDDIQIGSPSGRTLTTPAGAYFDYSSSSEVNIKVQLWGYVRYPGFYVVPAGININELISFAGGPTPDARLEDVRVTKIKEGAKTVMLKYNYNDLMWEENLNTQITYNRLEAGDIVVVPGYPRYFVRDDISFYLTIVTALASISALVISIIYAN